MFISGQHGNETTPMYALLGLAEELASTRDTHRRKMLCKLVVAIVPISNPDGFEYCIRFNQRGKDLNRNWGAHDQPETQALLSFVGYLRPQVAVDEHEGKPSTVEIPRYGSTAQRSLTETLARAAADQTGSGKYRLRPRVNGAHLNPNLAHRYLAGCGICGMLVETPGDNQIAARTRTYRAFSSALMERMAFPSRESRRSIARVGVASKHGMKLDLAGLYTSSHRFGAPVPAQHRASGI